MSVCDIDFGLELRKAHEEGYAEGRRDAVKWISVKDRLPEDGQKVLVCGTRKGMQVGVFRGLMHPFDAMGWWWKKDTRLDVTHWMPLPESPEEEA